MCRVPIKVLPGQYYDAETGIVQNVNREYDPSTGRYIQSDPIGLSGGISTYLYVSANPLKLTDPMGLDFGGAGATGSWDSPTTCQAPIGASMDFVQNTLGINLPASWWNAASATFAGNVSGTATAVILNPGRVWTTIEQPILIGNGIPIEFIPPLIP